MAGTLYIAEYGNIQAYPTPDTAQVAQSPSVALQNLAMTSTAATASAAFNLNTQIVRLYTDTNCWVLFSPLGTSICTATATAVPLTAYLPEYFGVRVLGTAATQGLSVISSA